MDKLMYDGREIILVDSIYKSDNVCYGCVLEDVSQCTSKIVPTQSNRVCCPDKEWYVFKYKEEVELNDEKPVFKPITITLETAQEYFSVLAALGLSSGDKEIERLRSLGISVSKAGYESEALYLHGTLCQYFDKVKGTL